MFGQSQPRSQGRFVALVALAMLGALGLASRAAAQGNDTTPPSICCLTINPQFTTGPVTLSMQAFDLGSGMDRVEFRITGPTHVQTPRTVTLTDREPTANTNTYEVRWTPTRDFENGNYDVVATAYDKSGNNDKLTGWLSLSLDKLPPACLFESLGHQQVAGRTTIQVRSADTSGVDRVELRITNIGTGQSQTITQRQGQNDLFTFNWDPSAAGFYDVVATCYDKASPPNSATDSRRLQAVNALITQPSSGARITGPIRVITKATTYQAGNPIALVEFWFKAPGQGDFVLKYSTTEPIKQGGIEYGWDWDPSTSPEGAYELKTRARASFGAWYDSSIVPVTFAPDRIVISPHAFLLRLPPLSGGSTLDTGVSAMEYDCGVFGIAALNGDIKEGGAVNPVRAYLFVQGANWFLDADFASHNRHETWQVNILCLSGEIATIGYEKGIPFFFQEYQDLGDNVNLDTGIRVQDFVCGIVGFDARDGDINENGTGDILQTYLYQANGSWFIRADFRTHNNHENWDVTLLCADSEIASANGLQTGKSVFLQGYSGLGDNINYDTGIRADHYVCGVVGFAALDGDINENDAGDILQAFTYASAGTWRIRADFRTHNNQETWNVNLLCFGREGVAPAMQSAVPTWFGVPWGPGIALTWTGPVSTRAVYYDIRASETGGACDDTWTVYNDRREIFWGGWINHHGSEHFGPYTLALPSARTYFYCTRVLDIDGVALTGWSNVMSGTSPTWPALNLAPPTPPGPYLSGEVVTLTLSDARGDGLTYTWDLDPGGKASATVESGCGQNQSTCVVRIFLGNTAGAGFRGKLAAPALDEPSDVTIRVVGKDVYGNDLWDSVVLSFEPVGGCTGNDCLEK